MRQRQTGFNIKEIIDVVLDEFGFSNDDNYFVTDSARNMITALDDKERYSCSCHNINLALKHTLNNENEIIKIKETIDCIKGVDGSIKRKGLMRKFAQKHRAIPQEIETRFNSTYQVFAEQYENLKEFIKIGKELQIKRNIC
jgi:hypothetical protein